MRTNTLSLCFAFFAACVSASAANLKVLKLGLGTGTVTFSPSGTTCGTDCQSYASAITVTITVTPAAGSNFSLWGGDCSGTGSCSVTMSADRSVRVQFGVTTSIPTQTNFTPAGISAYLAANPGVDSPALFLKSLPIDFKQNWILMVRSESLQTGTSESPRILLPSADARAVFTIGMTPHSSYPGSSPNAIEFMQWDAAEKNFRFHEIVLAPIPAMGTIGARTRGVSADDAKCFQCHSTRNVLNRSTFPGTTGVTPGTVKFKNKPNWDTYDSWGGMLSFNRDRIYQGSVEAAAFRKIFNLWNWQSNGAIRSIIEQLVLQPPGVPAAHVINVVTGGANDGAIGFSFDSGSPVTSEPAPSGPASATVTYSFNGVAGTPPGNTIVRDGAFITLHHSDIPASDEGRGVHLFDLLGGLGAGGTNLNSQRVADELISHRFATGSVPIDIRPIALAIKKGCVTIDTPNNRVIGNPSALTINLAFFDSRNGLGINDLFTDTTTRTRSIPRRKADIQRFNLDRSSDVYLAPSGPANGLVQQFGAATSFGLDTSFPRLRQEVFRRPIDLGNPDATVMGGIYVDRELYGFNTPRATLFRYFLEPLGVSVDKWSMGVRGRSRTYSFADVFGTYMDQFQADLESSLTTNPVSGLSPPFACAGLIPAVNATLGTLPGAADVPKFTDVQRIFNKSCIECHGGLGYPPYSSETYGTSFDLSENESPAAGELRLDRPYGVASSFASSLTSPIYRRITRTNEDCPGGVMPCGGPPLSKTDIETIRRWIVGGNPYTVGDPHIRTMNGINYDFQSAGEFVLLRGEGLEIQARHTPVATESPIGPDAHTGLTSCVSINSAFAVKLGRHRISYQPERNGLQLRIDGKPTEIPNRELILPSGDRILRTSAAGGLQLESAGGTVVVLTPGFWDYYQVWYINLDVRQSRATDGVMGTISPGNWLPALADGTLMGPRPAGMHQRYVDLHGKFADSWRVRDTSSLFDYAPGASTKSFTLLNWPPEESGSCIPPRGIEGAPAAKPPAKALPLEVARQQCAALVATDRRANCEKDVMATGEAGFAKTYLVAERIERNTPPAEPALIFPNDLQKDLDPKLNFSWDSSTDSDGDPVTYRHCVWDAGTLFSFSACQVLETPPVWRRNGTFHSICAVLIGLLLLAIMYFVGVSRTPSRVGLVILAIVIAASIAYFMGRTAKESRTLSVAQLNASGKSYFWKVLAEDSNGGKSESETFRFTVK